MRLFLYAILIFCSHYLSAKTWEVGYGKSFSKPSDVVNLVSDSDTVLIDAGIYLGDVATWKKNNLVIKGVGGKAHLKANGSSAGGKAIWVIQGNNNYLENIEFSDCKVPDHNGAGIRMEGTNLTIKNCYFHHNENGILAGDNANSTLIFESCEFAYNGYGDGYTHNMYINHIQRFVMKYCYSHHAHVGHNVKSRAHHNEILFNRIMDEADGDASMQIDLPNGGFSVIMGNIIMQGPAAINRSVITYGLEGLSNPSSNLWIVNNTFVNKRNTCTFIKLQNGSVAMLANNIFAGTGTIVDGTATEYTNFHFENIADAKLENESSYNYHLTVQASVINQGTDLGYISAYNLVPQLEYEHPMGKSDKTISVKIDAGAYEFHGTGNADIIDEPLFSVYPIPSSDIIYINSPDINNHVEIYDHLGRKHLTENFNSTKFAINVSFLNEGIYLLRLNGLSKVIYVKMN